MQNTLPLTITALGGSHSPQPVHRQSQRWRHSSVSLTGDELSQYTSGLFGRRPKLPELAVLSIKKKFYWFTPTKLYKDTNKHTNKHFTFSDSVSKAEVASSRSNILGLRTMARAIATLCFCPPDNCVPFSPTTVSYPYKNIQKH